MKEGEHFTPLPGDNPISDHEKDVLERADVAGAFARKVLELDVSHGATVGVFGPWGSGKTSFVNLARRTFERRGVPVLDFNPWLFSGAEQLVERFFAELSAIMGMKEELKEIGQLFSKYGAAINAIGGAASIILAMPQIGAIVKAITKTADTASQPESVNALRKKIECALGKNDQPIIVVLDDVDRLSTPEIREVFKLVRLTASFPNLIYIVSCDRLRVEQALDEKGQELSGRDYLEKIIQWSFNLPEIPGHLLAQQLFRATKDALTDIENPGPFDERVWDDVYTGILRPLIRNIRDIRRFAIAIRETVSGLDGQVALADVLALEAIRVFLPDVFRLLPGAIDGLTDTSRPFEREIKEMMPQDLADSSSGFHKRRKKRVDGLVEIAGENRKCGAARTAREVTEAMLDCLFPAGANLRRMSDGDSDPHVREDTVAEYITERRVAHEHVFRRYLERWVNPDLLASHDAERALARMTDRDGLNEFIRSLESTRWQDVVENLCYLSARFRPEHVEPGVAVLLDLWPDMPERPSDSNVLRNGARMTVRIAINRLLRTLKDAAAVEAAVRRILPGVRFLSPKVELVHQIVHRENSDHKFVSETAANEIKTMLRNEIRAASADDVAEERRPSRVLNFAKHYCLSSEEPFEIDDSPKLTFALLRDICGGDGDRIVLDWWEHLTDLYGGEEVLKIRINDLKARFESLKPWLEACRIPLDEAENLLELADKYLSGWRPAED